MAYEIQAADNYNLVQLYDPFVQEDLLSIQSDLAEGLIDSPYIIIQSMLESDIEPELIALIGDLNREILDQKGLMLMVDFDYAAMDILENAGLTNIPSFDEAIDYIFMDQLEKELGSE